MPTSHNASYGKSKYTIVHNNRQYINKLYTVKKYPILRVANQKVLTCPIKLEEHRLPIQTAK